MKNGLLFVSISLKDHVFSTIESFLEMLDEDVGILLDDVWMGTGRSPPEGRTRTRTRRTSCNSKKKRQKKNSKSSSVDVTTAAANSCEVAY
jgi:hypothetical protein